MRLTGGIAGLWIARLIARADPMAPIAPRLLSPVISSRSLPIAAFGLARLASPREVDALSEGCELLFGAALICCHAALGSDIFALRPARNHILHSFLFRLWR